MSSEPFRGKEGMPTEPEPSHLVRPSVVVLRRRQVLKKLGISNTTLYQWIKLGLIPVPFSMGGRTQVKMWLEADIDRILTERAAATAAAANNCPAPF